MSFERHALAVFYSDPEVLVLAVLAWTGMMLYRALATIPDARQKWPPRAAAAVVVAFYFGAFPLPARPFSGWLVLQHLIAVGALAALGPVILHGVLLDDRALRSAVRPVALSARELLIVYAPAAFVTGWIVLDAVRVVPVLLGDPARGGALADRSATFDWSRASATVVLYVAASAPFNVRTRRLLRGVRLDAAERWSALAAGAATLWGALLFAVHAAWGPDSAAAQRMRIGMYLVGLTPGLVELRWAYDGVLRRVLAFHVLLAVYGVLVIGGYCTVTALGLVDPVSWAVVLTALAGSTLILPRAIERGLERWLFPRAHALRARLLEIAARPVGGTRADAGADLLARVVEAVDCEGGLVVLQPAAGEPATIAAVGQADAAPLGATAAEAAGYLGALGFGRSPHDVRSLPPADQVRLAASDARLVCPLMGEQLQGTLLLGPRRGWIYDEPTLDGLEMLGRNAGLALENLTLASARLAAERALAHGEKLAALGEAAARIAHEIRNPLTAARSLLQQATKTADTDGLVTPALDELDRIGRLVTDLLTFARREEVAPRDDVDLVTVCRRALDQVAPLAAASAVAIEVELASAAVVGDRDRLVQVVANLCRNGIEASAEGHAPRRLALRCGTKAGLALVEVRDSGPGIPAGEIERLFEPFRTTKRSGTGLGLPIARRIVEAHGGRLVAEGVPGAETVFRIELPVAERARASAA